MAENFDKIKQSIIDLSEKKISELLEKESKVTETKYLEAKKEISSETRTGKREINKQIESEKVKLISKLEIELNKSKREITEELVNKLIEDIKADLIELKKDKKKYQDILTILIKECTEFLDSNELVIISSPDDKDIFTKKFLNNIEKQLGLKLEYGGLDPEITGGVFVKDKDHEEYYIDNSYEYRLEMAIPEIRKMVSQRIEKE